MKEFKFSDQRATNFNGDEKKELLFIRCIVLLSTLFFLYRYITRLTLTLESF